MKHNLINDYSVREYVYEDKDCTILQPSSYPGIYKESYSNHYPIPSVFTFIKENEENKTVYDL